MVVVSLRVLVGGGEGVEVDDVVLLEGSSRKEEPVAGGVREVLRTINREEGKCVSTIVKLVSL